VEAFNVIKDGYKPEFDQWKECANESHIKVLADTCRTLRYLNKGERPQTTTYHAMFQDFPDRAASPPSDKGSSREKGSSRNASTVPFGSIGMQSEKNVANNMHRHQELLLGASRRQAALQSGSIAFEPEDTFQITTTTYSLPAKVTIHKNMQASPNVTKQSLTRESWHSNVHSTKQKERHDLKFIKPGETDWNMCGVTGNGISEAIHDCRDPRKFPLGGPSKRSRLVPSKMARFANENARLLVSASAPSL